MLLLAAAKLTGLLDTLVTAVMQMADATIPGLCPPNRAVVERLILTLLFLPVAGLARTWDLRSYTGTLLALVTGRQRAYSQRSTERFLACLAHAGAAQYLTEVTAQWTWSLWQAEQPLSFQPSQRAVFYVDGHHKAVYSDVLVPRGPIGKLGGKILGCRELVVLHDALGHALLIRTHRGDHHLTASLPQILSYYEQATGQRGLQWIVVDREGMAAEFLAQQKLEGRQVITLLRANQYEGESSFEQVGQWQPWRYNRDGQMICEVASARFALARSKHPEESLEVEVALIRDWRKMLPTPCVQQAADERDWKADLLADQAQFWQEGWQATPAPATPRSPKLIAVMTTGQAMPASELADRYFHRWDCQENAIRDWLIPLNLDINHGYAKEPVVNSELTKRQAVLERREHRLEDLAQARRERLAQLKQENRLLTEQIQMATQRSSELLAQVTQFETEGRIQERAYISLKAQYLAANQQVSRRQARREKNVARSHSQLGKCEQYSQKLRQVLRQQEDLQFQARDMYELDHSKDQIMTLLKLGLANLGMWVRDQYFGESYQHAGWQRLLPFFKLGGWVTATADEVKLEVCAFNNRALVRDLEELCCKVNQAALTLPDGRRLVMATGKPLHARLDVPLAHTG